MGSAVENVEKEIWQHDVTQEFIGARAKSVNALPQERWQSYMAVLTE